VGQHNLHPRFVSGPCQLMLSSLTLCVCSAFSPLLRLSPLCLVLKLFFGGSCHRVFFFFLFFAAHVLFSPSCVPLPPLLFWGPQGSVDLVVRRAPHPHKHHPPGPTWFFLFVLFPHCFVAFQHPPRAETPFSLTIDFVVLFCAENMCSRFLSEGHPFGCLCCSAPPLSNVECFDKVDVWPFLFVSVVLVSRSLSPLLPLFMARDCGGMSRCAGCAGLDSMFLPSLLG